MGVYEYRGEPGMGYLYLATAAGTAPHTDLTAGDRIDFGDNEPPADSRWIEAPDGAVGTKLPDNHPENQPVVQWPEPELEPEPENSSTADAEPASDTTPAEPTKRSKTPAKTTA